MIIENQAMVTDAVVEAVSRAEDPRLREILLSLVRHLHGFVREVRLTEREFQEAVGIIVAMGQKTTSSHNEGALMAGSLGVSSLVCLLNNGNNGQSETQANMLGPFWRDAHRRQVRGLSFMLASKTSTAVRSREPKSMSGIRRPKVSMRIRIQSRPR